MNNDIVFIPHSTEVWAPVRISGIVTPGADFSCTLVEPCDSETTKNLQSLTYDEKQWTQLRQAPFHDALPPFKDATSVIFPMLDSPVDTDNITQMHSISEANILHAIRARYKKKIIYTNVGTVVLAMNPFQNIPNLYTKSVALNYAKSENPMSLPPHVYQLCSLAYCNLAAHDKDQCMLITGESGAGKTETTKFILSYYADVCLATEVDENSGGKNVSISDQIMMASPILESFGNASTSRNANSSRFGKWISICFDQYNRVRGAEFLSFMLEMPRVCQHASTDRSYHIFYYIVDNRLGKTSGNFKDYRYLRSTESCSSGSSTVPHQTLNNQEMYENLLKALNSFGFTAAEQQSLFNIIASILHLSNISFTEATIKGIDGCKIHEESNTSLHAVVELLEINADSLVSCFLNKTIVSGRESVKVPLTPLDAEHVRDNLAKLIYRILFQWLIWRLNEFLAPTVKAHRCLSVLDIAGFENFNVNSLEQLLFNLSNEQLQYLFNQNIIASELEDYKKEGIQNMDIKFYDNYSIVELLGGKGGVIDILDEELFVPKGSEKGFLTKLTKKFSGHSHFVPAKFSDDPEFTIRHFADNVKYSVENWLDKNRLYPPNEVVDIFFSLLPKVIAISSVVKMTPLFLQILQTAKNFIVKDLLKFIVNMKKNVTVGNKFLQQLKQLINTIEQTDSYYIRCIKPNPLHDPWDTKSPEIIRQLRCTGIIEAVKVRKSGYLLRIPYKKFCEHYAILAEKTISYDRSGCELIIDALRNKHNFDVKDIHFGYTKFMAKDYLGSLLDDEVAKCIANLRRPIDVFLDAYDKALKEQKGMFLYPIPILDSNVTTPELLKSRLDELSMNLNALEKQLGDLSNGPSWVQHAFLVRKAMATEVEVVTQLYAVLEKATPLSCSPEIIQQLSEVKKLAEEKEVQSDALEKIKSILICIKEEKEWGTELEQQDTDIVSLINEISRCRHQFYTPSFDKKFSSAKKKLAVTNKSFNKTKSILQTTQDTSKENIQPSNSVDSMKSLSKVATKKKGIFSRLFGMLYITSLDSKKIPDPVIPSAKYEIAKSIAKRKAPIKGHGLQLMSSSKNIMNSRKR